MSSWLLDNMIAREYDCKSVSAKTSNALFPACKEKPIAGNGYVTCESKIYFKKDPRTNDKITREL